MKKLTKEQQKWKAYKAYETAINPAWKAYEAIRDPAYKAYEAIHDPARVKFLAKIDKINAQPEEPEQPEETITHNGHKYKLVKE